jgi:hypothetical protein
VGQQIRTKLFVVAILQRFTIHVSGARKVLYVIAIPLIIPLKL